MSSNSENFKEFISSFYKRRIKRLVPALFIYVLLASLLICLFHPDPTIYLRTGIFSLLGLSNIYLLKTSVDYFGESAFLNPFTQTWSLGLEEQFYFIFPFLIYFSSFNQKLKSYKNKFRNLILFLTIISFFVYIFVSGINKEAVYFLMPARFWEISIGVLIFLIEKDFSLKSLFTIKYGSIATISLITFTFFYPQSYGTLSTVIIVFATSFLLLSLKKGDLIYKLFSNSKVVHIGKISYSLYLWHWGIICFSRFTIGVFWWTIPFQLVLIYIISFLSYKYIENPIRFLKSNINKKVFFKRIIISIICFIGAIFSINQFLKGKIYLSKFKSNTFINVHQDLKCETKSKNYIKNPYSCLTKSTSGNVIWLFGNSHASNLAPSLESIKNDIGYSEFLYLTNSAFLKEESELLKTFANQLNENDLIIVSFRNTSNNSEEKQLLAN